MTGSYREAKASSETFCGVGLGLRWDFLEELVDEETPVPVRFLEVSPENYMRRGGYFPQALERLSDRYRLITHGLTMSVGAAELPEDEYFRDLLGEIGRVGSPHHSDHLCLSTAGPYVLHDLLPLRLSKAEARRVADRVRVIQDRLGVPFAVENISFYAHPAPPEMSEEDFICEVLRLSEIGLLLDVNNVYVNAQNHGFDARSFIAALPSEQVVQLHIAGHSRLGEQSLAPGLLLDTHGSPVAAPVQELLQFTLERTGPVPVLLERDNDVPPLAELLAEVAALQSIYEAALTADGASG